jgi:hypothetical protein
MIKTLILSRIPLKIESLTSSQQDAEIETIMCSLCSRGAQSSEHEDEVTSNAEFYYGALAPIQQALCPLFRFQCGITGLRGRGLSRFFPGLKILFTVRAL